LQTANTERGRSFANLYRKLESSIPDLQKHEKPTNEEKATKPLGVLHIIGIHWPLW